MTLVRIVIGLAIVACGGVAAVAKVGLSGSEFPGLEGDDPISRQAVPMLGRDVTGPLPSATIAPPAGNPLWGITLESLRATRERPLFTPSRRPPMPQAVAAPRSEPVPVAAKTVEPEQPSLNLVGIVTGSAEGYAVFVNTATHGIVRLKTGEGHDGWVLQSVGGRAAVLEKNHKTAVVSLPLREGDHK